MHGLKAKVHQLGLFVLHGKDHDKHHVLERLLFKAEESLRAVLYDIHN